MTLTRKQDKQDKRTRTRLRARLARCIVHVEPAVQCGAGEEDEDDELSSVGWKSAMDHRVTLSALLVSSE